MNSKSTSIERNTTQEILEAALWQVITNGGAPGVDGVDVQWLKEDDGQREQWLRRLEETLRGKAYKPSPVRRVYIPKADGKQRPLGIPTVRDRVVQTAVVILLLPIFEADFHENSYAYRPKRRAQQALDAIKVALLSGRREIVDADLSGYFDSIPHAELLRLVKGRVSDGRILKLIKGWLRAPIVDSSGLTRSSNVEPISSASSLMRKAPCDLSGRLRSKSMKTGSRSTAT